MANKFFVLVASSFFILNSTYSQEKDSAEVSDKKFRQVESLVRYYGFVLNTIGAAKTPVSEKETIINDSYLKIFSTEKVQIEDDLVEDRVAILNKDIQSYLRDVDFFYSSLSFEFDSIEIIQDTTEIGETYFLASFTSQIAGIDLKGDSVNSSRDRFMEINETESGLKIESIYTTKVSKEKLFQEWWDRLPGVWVTYFSNMLDTDDIPMPISKIMELSQLDSISFQSDPWVSNIEPLSMLKNLRYVNLDQTNVKDLTPLRSAKNLKYLSIANTLVNSLDVLRYFPDLKYLDITQNSIPQLDPIKKTRKLSVFKGSRLISLDFEPIAFLEDLRILELSKSSFSTVPLLRKMLVLERLDLSYSTTTDLTNFPMLPLLEYLDLDFTDVNDLSGLEDLPALKHLKLNGTSVSTLNGVSESKSLRRIEADFTKVTEENARQFMAINQDKLVVVNSQELLTWWDELSDNWKETLHQTAGLPREPNLENLIRLSHLESLDVSSRELVSGEPLKRFSALKNLKAGNNEFENIDFIAELQSLETLDLTNTVALTFAPMAKLEQLKQANLSGSNIKNLQPFEELQHLTYLNVEGSGISKVSILDELKTRMELTIIFRSAELSEWWSALSMDWKRSLMAEADPSNRELHLLTQKKELIISGNGINDLSHLSPFANLEVLKLESTSVTDLRPLTNLNSLISLSYMTGPLNDLSAMSALAGLLELTITNTGIEDLRPLIPLKNLQRLNCSGNLIKSIRPLENLTNLSYLDISNTKAWRLHWLDDLKDLNVLICFNSRVNDKKISEFKSKFPNCEVTYY